MSRHREVAALNSETRVAGFRKSERLESAAESKPLRIWAKASHETIEEFDALDAEFVNGFVSRGGGNSAMI